MTAKQRKYPRAVRIKAPLPPATAGEPEFEDWRGKLGWSFTAEECRREYYTKKAAEKFMKTYGQPYRIKQATITRQRRVPDEMRTADAAFYLGISTSLLTKGVTRGYLERYKKLHDTSFWYRTSDLDRYAQYLQRQKDEPE